MDKPAFFAGFASCMVAIVLFAVIGTALTEQPQARDEGQFTVSYEADTEPFLDAIALDLNDAVQLRSDITLVYKECGKPRLYQQGRTIVVCAEAVQQARDLLGSDDAAYKAIEFSLYHETGHALIDMYRIPFTGREEDVADQFATMLLVQQGKDDVALSAAERYWQLGENKKLYLWDVHSLDQQRYYNINCWVYGSDTGEHTSLVKETPLPEQRASHCKEEYNRIERGWNSIFSQYLTQQ